MHAFRPWLFVGKYRDTLKSVLLKANGIEAMLQFAELVEHPGVTAFHLPVEDGVPLTAANFQRGLNFVLQQHQQHKKILIPAVQE